jgi:glycosyltransferase involved in cell wall biosynthesis
MRVAVVAGTLVEHDAISAAAVDQAALCQGLPGVDDVRLFTQFVDRPVPCATEVVTDPWSLLRHPWFRAGDVAIFHWGIRYDLFDALTLVAVDDRPHAAVHFHNCTPAELVPEGSRPLIEQSIRQLHHAIALDLPLWTYSEYNRRTLLRWGAAEERVRHVPFPVGLDRDQSAPARRDGRLEALCLGRVVPAKGQHVLVDAVARLDPVARSRLHLVIAGSTTFSHDGYIAELRSAIVDRGLTGTVDLLLDAPDEVVGSLMLGSHLLVSPSFHEGFCVPVIEAYLAGCRVIGTTAGNLPFVVQDPDPCVPPGDPAALAAALAAMLDEIDPAAERPPRHEAFTARYGAEASRDSLQRELYLLYQSGGTAASTRGSARLDPDR